MLKVKNLSLKYGEKQIFKDLSFSLESGKILGIRGVNGCGKSSLCLCLASLMEGSNAAVSGEVNYGGKRVEDLTTAERCAEFGIIFQNPDNQLFSPLVLEELAFALENLNIPRKEMQARIDETMLLTGISHLIHKKTNALSGGEKQLVAITAVLCMRPKLLICDEITARLDIENKVKIRQILSDHARSGGSVIIVSHNPRDLSIADNIITLSPPSQARGSEIDTHSQARGSEIDTHSQARDSEIDTHSQQNYDISTSINIKRDDIISIISPTSSSHSTHEGADK